MNALTPWHLLLIFAAFLLLAGYKRLPDATRSLGRSMRIFRSEIREQTAEEPAGDRPVTGQQPSAVAPAASVTELEREAAAAEALAAQLRARAIGSAEGSQPAV